MRKYLSWLTICAASLALACLLGCRVEVTKSDVKPFASNNMQKILLRISGIGLGLPQNNRSDEEMLADFEKRSGIKTVVTQTAHSNDKQSYLSYLELAEHSDELPDIIIFPSLSALTDKAILYDISDFIEADAEWNEVPLPLRKAVTMNGDVFAVPLRYSLEGYFINQTLLRQKLPTSPSFGFSLSQFEQYLRALHSDKQLLPLSDFYRIPLWYPYVKESTALWGAYGNSGLDLESKSFCDGIRYAQKLREEQGTELSSLSPDTVQKQWQDGKIAFLYGSTENQAEIYSDSFVGTFIGIPGGTAILDASYIGINIDSSHKKEAFALIKWLSFSSDGVKRRLSAIENPLLNQIPLTRSSTLLQQFTSQIADPGISEALKQIDRAVVRGDDYLPRYHYIMHQARYQLGEGQAAASLTHILQSVIDGKLSYPEISAELNRLVHRIEERSE